MSFTVLPLQVQHPSFIAECLAHDMPTNPVQRLLYASHTAEQARKDYESQFAMFITDPQKSHQCRWIRAVAASGTTVAWAEWQMPMSHGGKKIESKRGTVSGIEQGARLSESLDVVTEAVVVADGRSAQESTQEGHGESAEINATQGQKNEAATAFGRQWHEMETIARNHMLQGRTECWGKYSYPLPVESSLAQILIRTIVLCNLGTHPAFRKQGAGTILATWAFEDADHKGLPIILHAVSDGKGLPLYLKFGFEEKSRFVMDLGMLGGEGYYTTVCMLREPRLLEGNPDV